MSAHHQFSPSSLERRMLCPGSYRKELDLPEIPGEDAAEGTLLHEAVATGDISKLETEEQRELVQVCREMVVTICDEYAFEQKLTLFDDDFSVLTRGTADVAGIRNGDEGIVIDWKFGRNPVEEAPDNIQLAAYAAMWMTQKKLAKCTVYLVQPRLHLQSSHTFTNPAGIRDFIKTVIKRAITSDTLIPGEKQCRYCKAASNGCPALVKKTEELTPAVTEMEAQDIGDVPGELLTRFLLAAAPVIKAAERAKTEIRRRCMQNNGFYQDWELKPGRKTRTCTDIAELHMLLEETIETDRFLKECYVSVAALENLYAERKKASKECKTLKEAKALFAELTKNCISTKTASGTLEYVPRAAGRELPTAAEPETSPVSALNAGDTEDTCR